jgi:FMN phosphatase YigB (HAD superfamily)
VNVAATDILSGRQMADARAVRHLPHLMLDEREPYQPFVAGYTLFTAPGQSPSSKFEVVPKGALTIEYALWYDWDIGHLYELEHVWVHLDGEGEVIAVEASAHGKRNLMDAGWGLPEVRDGRPVLYCEPGKHAHWATPELIPSDTRRLLNHLCGGLAGHEGVHLGNMFAESGAYRPRPKDHRLARLKMRHDAFVPSFRFVRARGELAVVPWAELADWIPRQVEALMEGLERTVPHIKAVFLDCGDTLVDESTEVKRDGDVVLSGDLIPSAREALQALHAAGHKLILVADGPRESFVNLLARQHGLWDLFDAHIISEDIGELKPSAKMFDAALAAAGLGRSDARHVVMVGNNLARDIRGANALGITSVFMKWSTLRSLVAEAPHEHPDYTISSPEDLPALLDLIEATLRFRTPAFSSKDAAK